MTAATRKGWKPASIHTSWAITKSPELGLSGDNLHAVAYREIRKENMEQFTQGEINILVHVLQNTKDGINRDTRRKRTDEGGDSRAINLRHKIYALCDVLDQDDDHRRINGFAKRMFGVDRAEWLMLGQCGKVVEALKAILEREQRKEGQHETDAR